MQSIRGRWRWKAAGVLLALALLLAGGAVWWWTTPPRGLSLEEQQLLGRWEVRWDTPGQLAVMEYEFRPDRTCRYRSRYPRNGPIVTDLTGLPWELEDGVLTIRHPGTVNSSTWLLTPRQESREVMRLEPGGPNHFRYTGTVEVDSSPTGPPVSGTLTRLPTTE